MLLAYHAHALAATAAKVQCSAQLNQSAERTVAAVVGVAESLDVVAEAVGQ